MKGAIRTVRSILKNHPGERERTRPRVLPTGALAGWRCVSGISKRCRYRPCLHSHWEEAVTPSQLLIVNSSQMFNP